MPDGMVTYKKASRISLRKLGRSVLRGYGHLIASDLRGLRPEPLDLNLVMTTSRGWLLHNIDRTGDALAEHFHLLQGWGRPYPEITGYTITTLLEMQRDDGDVVAGRYARRMGRWLLKQQFPSGAWCSHQGGSTPSVFNTAQILDGLGSLYQADRDVSVRSAAANAARFLVSSQDEDGLWRDTALNGIPHTYYARAAWAMAKWGRIVEDDSICRAAARFLEWVVLMANDDGWFDMASFSRSEQKWPFTHTIAYVVEGLIEGGLCLNRADFVEAGVKASQAMADRLGPDGQLGGSFDRHWTPAQWECLTGTAQMARCWGRLAEVTGHSGWIDPLDRAVTRVARTVRTHHPRHEIRGAVKGSHPHWGPYGPYAYPSHAVKFFLDALLVRNRLVGGVSEQET